MENVISQAQNFMTFEHDQHLDPEIIAFTRALFALYAGPDADERLCRFMRSEARICQNLIHNPDISEHQRKLFRSRRQWMLHLLSIADLSRSHLRLFMARVIVDGADHGGAHARSAGAPAGAALATPHE